MKLLELFDVIDDEDAGRVPNPMPNLSTNDPRYDDWYTRFEEQVHHRAWEMANGDRSKFKSAIQQILDEVGTIINVPVDKLIGSEETLDPSGLETDNRPTSSTHPIVAKVDGELFIIDGNHRAARAYVAKEPQIQAIVVDVDNLEQQMAA